MDSTIAIYFLVLTIGLVNSYDGGKGSFVFDFNRRKDARGFFDKMRYENLYFAVKN